MLRKVMLLTLCLLATRAFAQSPGAGTASHPSQTKMMVKAVNHSGLNSTSTAERVKVAWQADLPQALAQASAENRLVIIGLYSDWCGWCRYMDNEVYPSPSVVKLSQQAIFVKLDIDRNPEGKRLVRELNILTYPTTLVLDANGRLLSGKIGYIRTPELFLEFVNTARQKSEQKKESSCSISTLTQCSRAAFN